jgi:hypothetical protein
LSGEVSVGYPDTGGQERDDEADVKRLQQRVANPLAFEQAAHRAISFKGK